MAVPRLAKQKGAVVVAKSPAAHVQTRMKQQVTLSSRMWVKQLEQQRI